MSNSLGKILGLGFLFGAKDTGVSRTTGKISAGLERVGESVERVGKQSAGLQRFGNVMSVIQSLQLDRVIDQLDALGEKAGVGIGGQANQLESFGATFAQTFRQARAGMGAFGKELDKQKGKIAGTAFNLGVGADELTKAVADITKTGSKLGDFGLDVRALGGAIQADIIGSELPHVLTSLAHGYDLGAKGAANLLDRQTALGEAFGVGADAAKAMPEILKAADPILAKFTNLKIDNVTDSLTRLAIASQKRIGGTFQQNMEDAIGVFNELGGAREQMAGLITGLSSDFPDLAKELSISSGDVGASMESIMADPLTFAKNMQQLNSTLKEGDPRALRLRLALGKLPAGFQFLVQGGQDAAKALDAASVPVKNFEGAFGKMVKGASGSTRTFAENMELLKDRFDNSLRSMTSQTDAQVVKRQKKAYDRLSKTLDELRKQGGPKGFLTRAFLDIRRHGLVHGLIPSLEEASRKMGLLSQDGSIAESRFGHLVPAVAEGADALKDFAVDAGPTLGALAQMGVFKPVAAAFGAVGGATKFLGKNMLSLGSKLPLGPLALFAGAGLLIYENWDVLGPAFMEIWGVLKTELMPAFLELKAIGIEVWESFKTGVGIIWNEYLVPFGKWFKDNLPAMIAAGTVAVIKSIAWLKWSFKALGVKAASTIDMMSAGWKYIATVVENRVVGAFEKVESIFTSIFESWDLGFLSIKQWLLEIPRSLAQMVKSIASSAVGKKALGLAGFNTDEVMQGIDKQISYWGSQSEQVQAEIDDRKRQSANEDLRRLDEVTKRERNEQAALAETDAAHMRDVNAMLDLERERDRGFARAESAGDRVFNASTAAMAAREAGEPAPAEAPVSKKRRRRGTVVAPTPAASPTAARQEAAVARYITKSGTDLSSFFKDGLKVTLDAQQVTGIATKVVAAANNRKPRTPPNGGGADVP